MATSTAAQNILNLAQASAASGKRKTNSTTTTQTPVSDQGVQELIQSILAGPGGVADIGARARGSGLYNSSSEDLLLGNLYARAANQAELARTPTIQTQQQTISGPSAGQALAQNLISIAATPLIDKGLAAGSKALGGVVDSAANALGFGSSSTAAPAVGVGAANAGAGAGLATSVGSAGIDAASVGIGSQLATGVTGAEVGSALGGGTSLFSTGLNEAGAAGSAIGSTATGTATGALGSTALSYLPYVGAFAGGALDGRDNKTGYLTSAGTGALAGAYSFGPVGAVVGAALGALGNLAGSKSIICTALMKLGLLSEARYALGQAYLQKLPQETKNGYHIWANWVAKEIEARNVWAISISLPIATSRMDLLASSGGFINHCRYPLGTLTKFIGEPACWLIGKLLHAVDMAKLRKLGV